MGKLFSWLKRNMLRLIVGSIVGSIIGGIVGAIVGAIVGLVFFGGGATIAVVLVFFEIGNVTCDISIRVRGNVRQSGRPDSVEMSVSAELAVPKFVERISGQGVKTQSRSGSQSLFDIETKLNVTLGDYVVLAAAPSR